MKSKPTVARAGTWSDGDALVLMRAAATPAAQTVRRGRAVMRWHRAMTTAGRSRPAARRELRAAAVGVCRRAKRLVDDPKAVA
jgi:hypothetical protein